MTAAVFDSSTIENRRRRAVSAFGDNPPLILIGAGRPIPKPGGLDQTYAFLPHPAYYWLTGYRRWGGVLAYDANDGWTHFVRPVTAVERLWEADVDSPPGTDVDQLENWLKQRNGRKVAALGGDIDHVEPDLDLSREFALRLDRARRPKDSAEMEILHRACRATAAGFARAREIIKPGATERAIQIELEAEMYRNGAEVVGYDTIVGTGPHAAVLHFKPGEKVVESGHVVLVDAGAEILGYTADVTRTYPAGDRFTVEQQAIYDIVLAAELTALDKCREGVEWHDVHFAAASELATGLRDIGIIRVSVEEALESEAIAMFFPHGVGHMVGLGVRDVGGSAPGREEVRICCGAKIRVDLPLEEGFLMTVEPGIYFVPAILDDPDRRERFAHVLDWDGLGRWRKVGGVRIEDNALVTNDTPEIITRDIGK